MEMSGWDVVYASSVARLNTILAQATAELLPTFSYTNPTTGITMSGSFGPWSITGGSANRIDIAVPITSGKLDGGGLTDLDLSGVSPTLNVALALVSKTAQGAGNLSFDIQDTSDTPTTTDGVIYLASPDTTGTLAKRDPTQAAASIVNDNLPKCFLANADKISFVFATVLLNPPETPWLTPTATRFSYFGSSDGSEQAVAIKVLTGQTPWGPDGLQTGVDPALINTGSNLYYALSSPVVLKNLLLPALPQAIGHGVSPSSFTFNPPADPQHQDTCSITNNGSFGLGSVSNAGTNYYPQINSFSLTINNNQLITNASGSFDVTGLSGAWVGFDGLQVVNELSFDPATQKISFKTVSQTQPSVDKHIPWEYWLLVAAGLIGFIIDAIIQIVVAVIDDTVQDALTGTGSFEVVQIPAATASWTGSGFTISSASLETALVLRG